jgi:hypothetical protein
MPAQLVKVDAAVADRINDRRRIVTYRRPEVYTLTPTRSSSKMLAMAPRA